MINKLKNKIIDIERFMLILFDEMEIQENLVWSKHTGDLIGCVDLQETNAIAFHVPVFFTSNVVNSFKFSFAKFGTKNATASQLFQLFWKAVAICETQCAIKVAAATCEEASTNCTFFRMHFVLTDDKLNADTDVVYGKIIFLVKISVISTSFLIHHIYLKLYVIF